MLASTIAVLLLLTDGVRGQSADDSLAAAKKYRLEQLTIATGILNRAIDDLVADAAANGDLSKVKSLVDQKRSLADDGKLPYSSDLTEAVKQYLESRKKLASELYQQYQRTISAYNESNRGNDATTLQRELNAFVAAEKQRIARVGEPAEEKKSKSTSQALVEYAKFYEEYCREIEEQETTARAQQLAKEFPAKANARLKGQTWTLHCPVAEIEEDSRGVYAITVNSPEELNVSGFDVRNRFKIKLSKEAALAIKPGDFFVISGSPVCTLSSYNDEYRVFTSVKGATREQFTQYLQGSGIDFSNAKVSIRSAATASTASKSDETSGERSKRADQVREFESPLGKAQIEGVPHGFSPKFEITPAP